MPMTPRNSWPTPAENQDPFFDDFLAMVDAIDASVFAVKETSNLVLMGGGDITFSAGLGTVSWSSDIVVQAATTGFTSAIPGTRTGGTVSLDELQFLYVQLTRAPQSTQSLAPKVGSKLDPGDDYLVLAYRYQNKIYWRNGTVQSDGESITDFGLTGDLAGDVTGPARNNTVSRIKGAKVQTAGLQLALGKVLEVVAGSNPIIAKFSNPTFYIARSGCDDLLVGMDGSFSQVIFPIGTAPTSADVGGGSIWVGSETSATLYRIDVGTLTILATFPLPAPLTGVDALLFDGSDIWIAQGSTPIFARLALATLTFTTYPTGDPFTGFFDLFSFGTLLFGSGVGRVAKIIKTTGAIADSPAPVLGGNLVIEPMETGSKLAILDKTNARLYRYDLVSFTMDAVDLDLVTANPVDFAFDGTNLLVAFAGGSASQVTNALGALVPPALGFTQALTAGAVPTSVVWDLINAVFWVAEGGLDRVEGVPQFGGAIALSFSLAGLLAYMTAGGGGSLVLPLSSVFYVDKNTVVAIPAQNGSGASPLATLVGGLALAVNYGDTIYLVPADYTAEGPITPTHRLNLICMDSQPQGAAFSGDISPGNASIGQLNIAASVTVECTGLTIASVVIADDFGFFGADACRIEGDITSGVSDGGIFARSSLFACAVIHASYLDLVNCDIGNGVGTAIDITAGGEVDFWDCSFSANVTITFIGAAGVIQVDRVTYHSFVVNAVTVVNGTVKVIGAPLQVWKNGTPVGDNVGILNILSDPFTAVNFTPPGPGEAFGMIAVTINSSGVWSLYGNLGSDEVSPTEIYPGHGIEFIPDLLPALGIELVNTNTVLSIRMALTFDPTQTSTKQIPANAVVHGCLANITTPFTGGTSIKVGRAGALTLLQDTTDNDPSIADVYNAVQDTDWGGADESVVVTVHNADLILAGAGFVTVLYSVPSA